MEAGTVGSFLENTIDITFHAEEIATRGYTIIPEQVDRSHIDALNAAADRALEAVDRAMAAGVRPAHCQINPYVRSARCFYCWDRSCRDLLINETVHMLGQAVLDQPRLWDMTVLEATPLPRGAKLGPFDWHRDFSPSVDDQGQSYLWVFACLTDVTSDNGATWVIPRSHRDKSIATPKHGAVSANRPPTAVQLVARQGDVIAINPAMLHAVGENRTEAGRRLVLVGMCRADRSPLLNHSAIAAPVMRDEQSERMRQLLRPTDAMLDRTWDVLPDAWPKTGDRVTPPPVDRRGWWQRLRKKIS